MLRHVGKIINTDARCVLVFPQLPEKRDHALVVNIEGLPPHFEQALQNVVKSPDGQATQTLADVLARRLMPDTSVPILTALHNAGLLSTVAIDNIILIPKPGASLPLRAVLEGNGATLPEQTDFAAEKFNPHLHNQKVRSTEERTAIALNLLREASDLRAAADRKAQTALEYAPELAPSVATDGSKTADSQIAALHVAAKKQAEALAAQKVAEAPPAPEHKPIPRPSDPLPSVELPDGIVDTYSFDDIKLLPELYLPGEGPSAGTEAA